MKSQKGLMKTVKIPKWILSKNAKSLHVSLQNQDLIFTPLTLLDSCKCTQCYNKSTNQRRDNIFINNHSNITKSTNSVDDMTPFWKDWTIQNVNFVDTEHALKFTCNVNQHNVIYEVENDHMHEIHKLNHLNKNLENSDSFEKINSFESFEEKPDKFLWNLSDLNYELNKFYPSNHVQLPRVPLSSLSTEEGMKSWIGSLIKYGFCIIEGVDALSDSSTYELVKYIGYYKNTLFGEFWSFENRMDFEDTAYTDETIEPHTDNTYFQDPTRIFFLHCVEYNAIGGESSIIDAGRVLSDFRLNYPKQYEILTKIPILFHYKDKGHHYVYESPIVNLDRFGNFNQIRFNHHDRFHLHHLNENEQELFFESYNILNKLIHKQEYAAKFLLQPGNVLTFDNWRVLHGRYSFHGRRRCAGFYSSSDDFNSITRILFDLEQSFKSLKKKEENI